MVSVSQEIPSKPSYRPEDVAILSDNQRFWRHPPVGTSVYDDPTRARYPTLGHLLSGPYEGSVAEDFYTTPHVPDAKEHNDQLGDQPVGREFAMPDTVQEFVQAWSGNPPADDPTLEMRVGSLASGVVGADTNRNLERSPGRHRKSETSIMSRLGNLATTFVGLFRVVPEPRGQHRAAR